MAPDVTIRRFEHKDRAAVRTIACDTALMGESCDRFFDGREVIADALSTYYTDCEPGSCWVAEAQGQVVGYLLGSRNVKAARETFSKKILRPMVGRALKEGTLLKPKNLKFFAMIFQSLLRGEFKDPLFTDGYPAELHINIAVGWRCYGIGGRLIAAYLDDLKRDRVAGVHFATFSDAASVFFKKQGFGLLYQTKRSYFRHVVGRDVNLYIFGKKL